MSAAIDIQDWDDLERMADWREAVTLLSKLSMPELMVLAGHYFQLSARDFRTEGWTKRELIEEIADFYIEDPHHG